MSTAQALMSGWGGPAHRLCRKVPRQEPAVMLGPPGAGTEQPSCRLFCFSRGGNLCPPAMFAKIWAVGVGWSAEHRLPSFSFCCLLCGSLAGL